MEVRRATYQEAKDVMGFDPFIGDRRVDNWRGELLVAVDGGAVVGFVAFSSNLFYNRPFIGALCVRAEHRRRGVASALVGRVLDLYDGLDVWASTEHWNEAAIGLFGKLGFSRRGQIEGLDDEASLEVFVCRPATPARRPGR